MGVDFICETKSFGCSYSGWHYFRTVFIEATIAYLNNFLTTQTFDEYNQIAATRLQEHLKAVEERANELANKKYTHLALSEKTAKDCLIACFLTEVSSHTWFGELLIQFGAAGIYALCNKSDCEGFYSVGNSVDICDLLQKIIPFIPHDEKDIEMYGCNDDSRAKELLEVFEESVEKKLHVRIC